MTQTDVEVWLLRLASAIGLIVILAGLTAFLFPGTLALEQVDDLVLLLAFGAGGVLLWARGPQFSAVFSLTGSAYATRPLEAIGVTGFPYAAALLPAALWLVVRGYPKAISGTAANAASLVALGASVGLGAIGMVSRDLVPGPAEVNVWAPASVLVALALISIVVRCYRTLTDARGIVLVIAGLPAITHVVLQVVGIPIHSWWVVIPVNAFMGFAPLGVAACYLLNEDKANGQARVL